MTRPTGTASLALTPPPPIAKPAQPTPASPGVSASTLPSDALAVLVVDDDPMTRALMTRCVHFSSLFFFFFSRYI